MARRPDLEVFAEKHDVKLGTIADLIEYRNNTETTIERVAECKMPTEFGDFDMVTYRDTIDNQIHYALRKGEVTEEPFLCVFTCKTPLPICFTQTVIRTVAGR
ncbi:3,4-dihydroxy-2-butanone 4-phosphate synthase [Vibrio sp. JCM 19236]|nr:3,4-dihydroxy-2-butanone 4-phosphate synthase [Vibrio sp. JCM 19236]